MLSSLGLFLALGCALAWTGVDAARKAATAHATPVAIVTVLCFGQAPIFVALAWRAGAWPDPAYLPIGLATLVLNVAANLLFVESVKRSPFSRTVPLLAVTPVGAALLGLMLLGETPTTMQWAGIALVAAGALRLNADVDARPWRAIAREPGSAWMLVVALLWSATPAIDKVALRHASLGFHALVQTLGVGLVTLAWLAIRGSLGELRAPLRRPRLVTALVFFGAAAIGLQLAALTLVLVAIVEAVKRAVGVVAGVALGRVLFGEPVTSNKVFAGIVLAIGAALVTIGGTV